MSGIDVSIVIPVFNSEKFIGAALDSVLSQTALSWEALIVDDGSSDGSVEIINAYVKKDPRFRLIQMSVGGGAAKARNAAIRQSQGSYIAFLDSDDLWMPDKLSTQIAAMSFAGAAMSCTAVDVIDDEGVVSGERHVPGLIDYSLLLRRTPIVTSSVIIDVARVGRLEMPDIIRRQDLALWLKIIRKAGPALGVDKVLGSYRVHEGSLSRNKLVSAIYTWRVIRAAEGMSMVSAIYYFINYAFKGVFSRLRGLN